MTIGTISEKLHDLAQKLEAGALEPDEIVEMTELARQFHERMIVIQYKAFEESVKVEAEPAQSEVREPEPEMAEPASARASLEVKEVEITEEISPNQISLIDSIEEIKRMEQSLNDVHKDDRGVSLGQKLNHIPIPDLKKAIGINQQFLFISKLFEGDKESYNSAVEKINSFSSYLAADEYIENTLKQRYHWESRSPEVMQFNNLVERRFL